MQGEYFAFYMLTWMIAWMPRISFVRVVTVTSTVPNALGDIVMTPLEVAAGTGQLRWTCTSALPSKYLPTECRP